MADRSCSDRQNDRRAWWRKVAIGSVASAAIAFYVLLVGKLMIERATNDSSRPAVAGKTESSKIAFEPTDWDVAPVAAVYIGVLVLIVISAFVIIAAYPDSLPDVSRTLHIKPPGPRLQTNPEADMQQVRAGVEKRLNGYYWIDKQKGTVHIPIEQAMQKLARAGIDGFPKAQQ